MSRNRYVGLRYARPTFLEGVGRLLDFGGFLSDYNRCPYPQDDRRVALRSDWHSIGDDMRVAIRRCAKSRGVEIRDARRRSHP